IARSGFEIAYRDRIDETGTRVLEVTKSGRRVEVEIRGDAAGLKPGRYETEGGFGLARQSVPYTRILSQGNFFSNTRTDRALYRVAPESGAGQFEITGSDGQSRLVTLGEPGDVPIPGDFDGDGLADVAVFQPA